ncbi:MAG TPA: MBL fold metallo-hydrolase [Bellilinea sp.]|nr:MBL fold metallo-hydrolase [Bellilinea sp.]
MEITWYGHSCFRITERNMATVVTDPFDSKVIGYNPLKLKGDIVTVSHEKPGHQYSAAVKPEPFVIDGPGEFEVGGVFITGIQTSKASKENGKVRNIIYMIDYNGITILHLGGIDRVPTQTEVEDLGPVNVVLVPIGGEPGLTASKAAEVISLLEPNVVIPMHYATPDSKITLDPVAKFLKEMGLAEMAISPSYKANSLSALPEETQVVLLEYQMSKE